MFILKHKVIYLLIFLLITTTGFLFLQKGNNTQIDNLVVKYDTIEISTINTKFIYSSIFKRKNNFHSDINNILKTNKPVNVMPNKELSFVFKQKPKSYMVVETLDNGNYQIILDVKEGEDGNNYIITPYEPGEYIYSISANYSEGVGIYYFSVNLNIP